MAEKLADDSKNAEALKQAVRTLQQAGVTPEKSPTDVMLVVITWIILVGLPIGINQLAPVDQATVINEVATVGLALAITERLRRTKD